MCKLDRQNHVLKMIICTNYFFCLLILSALLFVYSHYCCHGSDLGLDKWLVVTLLSLTTHLPVTALSLALYIDDCPFP